MMDNFAVGLYDRLSGQNEFTDFYEYVDDNGEFTTMSVCFSAFDSDNDDLENYSRYYDNFPQMYAIIMEKPRVSKVIDEGFEIQALKVYKDNSEIIKRSIQFEFCSDSEEIIVGDALIRDLSILKAKANLHAYLSHQKPNLMNRNALPNSLNRKAITITSNSLYLGANRVVMAGRINEELSGYSDKDYIYITNTNDEVLLVIKVDNIAVENSITQLTSEQIYLNVLVVRDDNIYDTAGNVIGNIIDGVS